MKQNLFLISFLLIIANSLQAQQSIKWEKSFGGTHSDGGRQVFIDNNGGYIIGGITDSDDYDVSVNYGYYDYWVVKLDDSRNIQWEKSFGGSSPDFFQTIIQTNDNGYILAGATMSDDGDISFKHDQDDAWIVKLSTDGNIEWEKCYGGSDDDWAQSIQQTTDGGFIIGGSTKSEDGDVSSNHGSRDSWVIKIDDQGNIEWEQTYGGSETESIHQIQQTNDGGYVFAGYATSSDGDVSNNYGDRDFWVVKINSTGAIQWEKNHGGSNLDRARSIQQTNDNGYIVAGFTFSNDGDVSGNHGEEDYWIVKLDSNGEITWSNCYGGSDFDKAEYIVQTNDNEYYISGTTTSSDGDVSFNHGSYDYWVLKLNNTGSILWEKSFGGSDYDYGLGIQEIPSGGLLVIGSASSDDGDISGDYGSEDIWIFETCLPDPISIDIPNPNNNCYVTLNATSGFSNYEWSTGETTQSINAFTGGTYSVIATNNNDCASSTEITIPNPTPIPLDIEISESNYCYVTLNATSGFNNYEWSTGETSQSINAYNGGTYSVIATNNNDCSSSTEVTISNPTPIPLDIEISELNYCNNTELTAIGNFNNYLWNTGETSQTIYISQSGTYNVTGYAEYDCESFATINAPGPAEPYPYSEICMITTDIQNEKNIVVYEPELNVGIDSVLIFRLNNSTSQYDQIGSLSINDASIFIDEESNPEQQYHQYKLAIKDTCGHPSELSNLHQTILLQANTGINNEVNLFWNPYIGFNYPNFGIYRKIENGDYYLIANVPNNTYTFTDNSSPSGLKNYQIRVEKATPCYSSKEYSYAASNVIDVDITSIDDYLKNNIGIHPNPCTDYIQINTKNNFKITDVELLDSFGKTIYSIDNKNYNESLRVNTNKLESGLFFVRVNKSIYWKLIKL